VLSKLFGTQLYDRITAELERQGQHAARDLDTAARRVASCVSAAAEAAGLSGTHREELAGLAPQAREQRLTAIGGSLRRRADAADEAQLLAVQAAESAREHARAARERVTRLLRVADARAAIDQHDATRPAYERGIQRLDRARRSAAMRPLLDAVGDAEDALARASAAALIDAETREVDDADDLVGAAIMAAAAAEPARLNSDELRRRRRALHRVTELEQRLEVEAATAVQARDRYHRAVDDHQRLLDARLAGMAATLAAALVDGQPCAVCGATEHPHPAASAAQEVTAAHVSTAKQRREADEAALRSAEVTAASTEQELADARKSAGDEDAHAIDAELVRLGEVVEVGERSARMLPALRDWAAARQVHALAVERARDEAGAAGFDSLAQARESVLDAAELADLERRTQAWRREHERRVAAAALAEFDGLDLAGLAAAEHEVDAAEHTEALAIAAATDAAEARGQARLACERFGAALTELAAAQAEQARLAAGAEPVVYLSKVTRGMAGQRRVALTTFVLRHWFEQVVQAANVRLAAMSSGRCELVRVDETGAKAERAGLTVEVLDRHTGEARSTRSLSGGETFYTSLSLALGLADVVRAEAGGVDLDTLFIDEGFGGLDAQTLDEVMAVIEELREHGRVVGIVSHLAELKELITERVEVRRLPDGSSTLRVVA
jgi:exonuclease SbcC